MVAGNGQVQRKAGQPGKENMMEARMSGAARAAGNLQGIAMTEHTADPANPVLPSGAISPAAAGSAFFQGQVTDALYGRFHAIPGAVLIVYFHGGKVEHEGLCAACALTVRIGDVTATGWEVVAKGVALRGDIECDGECACAWCNKELAPAAPKVCSECFDTEDICTCDEYEAPTANSYFEGRRID